MQQQQKRLPKNVCYDLVSNFVKYFPDYMHIRGCLHMAEDRGFDISSFYWMEEGMNPTPNDLEEILKEPEYELSSEEQKTLVTIFKEKMVVA